ncbi:heavy metal translocating P-type ATPase [Aurantivibrio infirmus]
MPAAPKCFHCGLAVSSKETFPIVIDGELKNFCCLACQSVASLLSESGFDQYYLYRDRMSKELSEQDQKSLRNAAQKTIDYSAYDQRSLQEEFVVATGGGNYRANLLIEGVHCAACTWLIEHYLAKQIGVKSVSVNLATHRCSVEWDSALIQLSQVMQAINAVGYQAIPATTTQQESFHKKENQQALLRLGLAGIGMVQVGSLAIALYAGALQDMTVQWQSIFRWISALIATPIVLFSARPFFTGALRSLKAKRLTMDVSIALAIGLAYVASVWATVSNTGEVYFDSVSMFTFFLLLGRYLEMRIRHSNQQSMYRLSQALPNYAELVERGTEEPSLRPILVKQIAVGDRLWIREGDAIPVDGKVIQGESHVNEAMLSGEATPIAKKINDQVLAGSVNLSDTLIIETETIGDQTRLSATQQVMEKAINEKPPEVSRADQIAGYFVAAVLVLALLVATYWWQHSPQDALWVVLSVLVVTCPCALSLATPVALTAATHRLRRLGFLVLKSHVVESLSRVSRAIFDKTGTLTYGDMRIAKIETYDALAQSDVLSYATAMEAGSNHPIASAFKKTKLADDFDIGFKQIDTKNCRNVSSMGVEAEIQGTYYRFGRLDFIFDDFCSLSQKKPELEINNSHNLILWLASRERMLARIELEDSLRDDGPQLVKALDSFGIASEILSGDEQRAVESVARTLAVKDFSAKLLPEQKLAHLRKRQAEGDCVLMVGDGLNDLPVLGGADVSIAMATATDLAQLKSDSVLLSDHLLVIPNAIACARFCARIIKQNLAWALCYNLLALPLAAMGMIPPYIAAIGMSLSSLLVVMNGARLYRFQTKDS